MKKIYILLALALGFMSTETFARRGFITYGNSEQLKVVFDFPNEDNYKMEDGKYVDLGVKYEVFEIMWMPFWLSKDPEFVFIAEGVTDSYVTIDAETLEAYLKENNLKKEDYLKVGIFDKFLGFFVVIGIAILYFAYMMFFGKDEEDDLENKPEGTME